MAAQASSHGMIANEIIRQLGTKDKFVLMTGAKHFCIIENGLEFTLPMTSTTNKCNRVRIKLTPDDLYNVQFFRVRGMDFKVIAEYDMISCDMLQDLFTKETGLYCTLEQRGAR